MKPLPRGACTDGAVTDILMLPTLPFNHHPFIFSSQMDQSNAK